MNELKFTQSKIDECIFYTGKTKYVLYADDSILADPDEQEIKTIVEDLKMAKLDITIEGDLQYFLGINIERNEDRSIHLSQSHLIHQLLNDLTLTNDNVKIKDMPAASS